MLSTIHYVYLAFVVLIFAALLLKKDIVIPCILGIFAVGLTFSGSVVKAVSSIYNTLIYAGNEFWGIIVIISLVVAMSKALRDMGADELMIAPLKRIMIGKSWAYWVVGFVMLGVSWLIWPSPSVALIGAILLPAAIKSGLPAIWAAAAMNLFGHGMALSSDFFIQGAPTITAKAANITPIEVMQASLPLWLVMSIVTAGVSFFLFRRDMRNPHRALDEAKNMAEHTEKKPPRKYAKLVALATPLAFALDVVVMWRLKLTGGDATALVGGTALILTLCITLLNFKMTDALEKVVDYLKDGFGFGIKVFTPVIIIGGFFFLGNEGIAKNILGDGATGLLNDISLAISSQIGVTKLSAVTTQALVAITTGLDGSGFSGLPIVGALAYSLSGVIHISTATLAALGQIITVWVGGGTIIPWAVIPVAAICGVSPSDLVRKNMVPVLCGIVATVLFAFFIL